MKFPYGIANFHQIITNGYFYQDRTGFIPMLEDEGVNLLFLRPRRFGKSLLLSILEHYYDVNRADEFEKLFGGLEIAKNPTPLRNSYLILQWDFSQVEVGGRLEDIHESLHEHINQSIGNFYNYYHRLIPEKGKMHESAVSSLGYLIDTVRRSPHQIYLLIDEYDNFANDVLMSRRDRETYQSLVEKEGILKTVFKAVKFGCTQGAINRVFITGVSPLVMSDMSSGYNIAQNIYLHRRYHSLCGFTEAEIQQILGEIVRECGLGAEKQDEALELMKSYYNGYDFSIDGGEKIYNPTMSLYFFKEFQVECKYPTEMLDSNLAMDAEKLRFITDVGSRGEGLILDILQGNKICVNIIKDRFSIHDIIHIGEQDRASRVSFLYYFGVLTLTQRTILDYCFEVPNLVIRGLYVERIRRFLIDTTGQDEGLDRAREFFLNGDIKPLSQFVEQKILSVFKNREYRWMNEFSLKVMFLCFLFWDTLFVIDSEPEIGRGYADLLLMVRPDRRDTGLSDILIEFKYVGLDALGFSGEQVRQMSDAELMQQAEVRKTLDEAKSQLTRYEAALTEKHSRVWLQKYIVVGIGLERIVATAV